MKNYSTLLFDLDGNYGLTVQETVSAIDTYRIYYNRQGIYENGKTPWHGFGRGTLWLWIAHGTGGSCTDGNRHRH